MWEFYHYRRELVRQCEPNRAHLALVQLEKELKRRGKEFLLVTQNVDGLHARAGSENIVELHGSLYRTRCTKCQTVEENRESPICPALEGCGAPDRNAKHADIPQSQLPRCTKECCRGLLRPDIVWFGYGIELKLSVIFEKIV